MRCKKLAVSSILGLVLIVAVVFPIVWIWFRMMHAEMSIIQADTINKYIEKGRFEITMLKESYEKPALLFSLMKAAYDYGFHGGVTSKLLNAFKTKKVDDKEYIRNVVVNVGGKDVECARVESVNGRYVLYWTQTEETGTKVYKPIAFFDDLQQIIRKDSPLELEFKTDSGFKVGEVVITLYFLKDNTVSIKSGGSVILKAENTGVYFVDGKDIVDNKITLESLVDNATVVRGVIATTYKGNQSENYAEFADCVRKMVQDFMNDYFEIFYGSKKPTNFYGMEFNGSAAQVTFDPNIERIHGSVWMQEGMNVTRYYNDTAKTPMVLLHSNMFAETNMSNRLAVLIAYGTEFVSHIEDWLINAIYISMNGNLEDYAAVNGSWKCGPLTCRNCPEDPIPTYNKSDFVGVIESALTGLESELNSQSLPGIKWDLVLLNKDDQYWMPVNENKEPCCGSAGGGGGTNPYDFDDVLKFVNYFSFEDIAERATIQAVYRNTCEIGMSLNPCDQLKDACNTLPAEEYNALCSNPVSGYLASKYSYDFSTLCSNLPSTKICNEINNDICDDDFLDPTECSLLNDSIHNYIKTLADTRDSIVDAMGIENVSQVYSELTFAAPGTDVDSCGLKFEYSPDKNIIHVEYQYLEDYVGERCGESCCLCPHCFHKYHICEVKYYHRYIFKDLRILVKIIDEDYKVLEDVDNDKKYEWKPLELDFIVNINVDDNTCSGGYCVFKDRNGNIIIPPERMKEITPQFIIAGIHSYSVRLPTEEELKTYWRG